MRLTVTDPDKLFFSADHHFGHDNIRKYARRPFATVREMDDVMTEKWNAKVPEDGLVIYVGDFMMTRNVNPIKQRRTLLTGKIVLIRGNHDPDDPSVFTPNRDRLAGVFDAVCDLLYLSVRESGHKKREQYRNIMASHFAMRVWNKSHWNHWHVYGHSHGGLPPQGKSWDVGVDNNGYAPVAYADLRDIMANLPDNLNLIKKRGRRG